MSVEIYRKGPCTVKYGNMVIGQTEGDIAFKYTPEWRLFMPDQSTGPQGAFIVREGVEVTVPLVPRADALEMFHANIFPAGLKKATLKSGGGNSTLSGAEAAGQTTITVASGTNFANDDLVIIDPGTPKAEIRTVQVSSNDLSFTEPLAFNHDSGAVVQELDSDPKLKYSIGNNRSNIQFAELLIDPLDGSDDIKIYKAICTGEVELPIKKEEESVIELTYVGVEDTTRANGDRLFAIGLQSVS